jgi:uncharacterized radical SAM protein YgiQ
MFLAATPQELKTRNIQRPDIILVTGDAYIDSPFMGISLVGRVLESHGFSVGIIAQPDIKSGRDITRLGEPRLFWGVSGGAVDSMVANYTASKKRRQQDDYTPGGKNTRRPDRAVIAYANLIRQHFKSTVPIVLGGIEASLRRIAHYDFWSNKIRRSILFDAKADYLLFGMAHATVVQLAQTLDNYRTDHPEKLKGRLAKIPGMGYISNRPAGIELPSFEDVTRDKSLYTDSFTTFYANTDPMTAAPISQAHHGRYLVLTPPPEPSTTKEMDRIHALSFTRDLHPLDRAAGKVRALETIRFSIPTHYGCYGECNFCAITVHQGRTVYWRSQASVLAEARKMTQDPDFKGYIFDLGGPTANMYGYECTKKLKKGACPDRRCLFPDICPSLKPDHGPQMTLLSALERLPGVKKVFINSGIRYDLILNDPKKGTPYLEKLVHNHVSGQMKVAPEHSVPRVLSLMGKQAPEDLLTFRDMFYRLCEASGKQQFLTYYLIAAHPGCTAQDMKALKRFTRETLKAAPEQVQIFTPTPSTFSTLMYYTNKDPFTQTDVFVEKALKQKERQKSLVTAKPGHSARQGGRAVSPSRARRTQSPRPKPGHGRKGK